VRSFFVSWNRHLDHGNYAFESFNGGLRFEFCTATTAIV